MGIVNDNFMLYNATGKRLYEQYARELPIIDYHCHLAPEMIANDHGFSDAYELFLGGDHYKWRQMRSCGIDEKYITGEGDRYKKWLGFAKILPMLIGNPLYHWTSLELKRYFDIDTLLTEKTAREVWDKCNEKLKQSDFSARELIRCSNVEIICTTDDPADDLRYHKQLYDEGFETRVLPTFRPDKAVEIGKESFVPYIEKIGVKSYSELVEWIRYRIEFFHSMGCRLSDHGLDYVPYERGGAAAVFNKKMNGDDLSQTEIDVFRTAMITVCAEEYSSRSWTMQLHIGVLRNNNTKMHERIGADTGFDSINDMSIAEKLSAFMNSLEHKDMLPKTVLYTLNPKDNYVLGTMLGNFQKAPYKGKMQFGSGWWFNDNRDGMEAQMRALANLGALGIFVGMLTDSRSFVSYPRHEYFRRILCNMIGEWVERGEYPEDEEHLKKIVEGICYYNAKNYFEF